ncbi:MAG: YceI family protein [Rhizobacter sp.]|nr:YceI family protein [Rhizobacter sp.]
MPSVTLTTRFCTNVRICARVGVCLLAFQAIAAQAQNVSYALDASHTRVHWEVSHFGTSTSRGRFDDITGSLQLNAGSGLGEVSIGLATASVNTGVAPLDRVLRGGYLASGEHPQAYFVASGWRWKAGEPLEVRGELTLRGVSLPLVLRAPRLHCQPHRLLQREVCGADLQGELQRSDFGVSDGLPFIGNTVRLLIQVEAIRQEPR